MNDDLQQKVLPPLSRTEKLVVACIVFTGTCTAAALLAGLYALAKLLKFF